MAEFVINVALGKEALVKELVKQLGGSVVDKKKKGILNLRLKARVV